VQRFDDEKKHWKILVVIKSYRVEYKGKIHSFYEWILYLILKKTCCLGLKRSTLLKLSWKFFFGIISVLKCFHRLWIAVLSASSGVRKQFSTPRFEGMVVFAENDCDGLILIIRMYTNQIENDIFTLFLALSKCINQRE
jgi:hypothetical protein